MGILNYIVWRSSYPMTRKNNTYTKKETASRPWTTTIAADCSRVVLAAGIVVVVAVAAAIMVFLPASLQIPDAHADTHFWVTAGQDTYNDRDILRFTGHIPDAYARGDYYHYLLIDYDGERMEILRLAPDDNGNFQAAIQAPRVYMGDGTYEASIEYGLDVTVTEFEIISRGGVPPVTSTAPGVGVGGDDGSDDDVAGNTVLHPSQLPIPIEVVADGAEFARGGIITFTGFVPEEEADDYMQYLYVQGSSGENTVIFKMPLKNQLGYFEIRVAVDDFFDGYGTYYAYTVYTQPGDGATFDVVTSMFDTIIYGPGSGAPALHESIFADGSPLWKVLGKLSPFIALTIIFSPVIIIVVVIIRRRRGVWKEQKYKMHTVTQEEIDRMDFTTPVPRPVDVGGKPHGNDYLNEPKWDGGSSKRDNNNNSSSSSDEDSRGEHPRDTDSSTPKDTSSASSRTLSMDTLQAREDLEAQWQQEQQSRQRVQTTKITKGTLLMADTSHIMTVLLPGKRDEWLPAEQIKTMLISYLDDTGIKMPYTAYAELLGMISKRRLNGSSYAHNKELFRDVGKKYIEKKTGDSTQWMDKVNKMYDDVRRDPQSDTAKQWVMMKRRALIEKFRDEYKKEPEDPDEVYKDTYVRIDDGKAPVEGEMERRQKYLDYLYEESKDDRAIIATACSASRNRHVVLYSEDGDFLAFANDVFAMSGGILEIQKVGKQYLRVHRGASGGEDGAV